jgi:excisionase family DNA binding protein
MAGKFFTVEEAAQRLGVSAEEVQRLVDRKELYPVRDGTTLKFKHDDIEQYAAEAGAASGEGSGLSLDLDADPATPAAADGLEVDGLQIDGLEIDAAAAADGLEIELGDSLQISGGASGGVTGSGGPAAGLSLDAELDVDGALVIEPPAASSPTPAKKPGAGPAAPPEPNTGTLPIDLSGIAVSGAESGSNATGSIASGSGTNAIDLSGMGSNVGSALSGVLEGGLSLEDSDVRKSGILSGPDFADEMASAIKASASSPAMSGLAGEAIEEFDPVPDEDDAGSDVVADESGTMGSSFLGDEASDSFSVGEDASSDIALGMGGGIDDIGGDIDTALLPDTSFSVWQVCGLVCCALLMLTGGFVMFDLIRTLGSPEDLSMSSPLLNPMSELFGWRR